MATESDEKGRHTTMKYRVGRFSEIPERGRVLVSAGGLEIGVFKVHDQLYAYENRCPHQGGPVCHGDVLPRHEEHVDDQGRSLGLVESEDRIDVACPWHGWEYDLKTGEHIADASVRLRAFSVHHADGDVFVEVE